MRKVSLVRALILSFVVHACIFLTAICSLRACSRKIIHSTEVSLGSIRVPNERVLKKGHWTAPGLAKPVSSLQPEQTNDNASGSSVPVADAVASPQSSEEGDSYALHVRAKILSFQHYPESAKSRKQEGTVVLNFELGSAGELKSLAYEATEAVPALIEAAQEAVRQASPFGPLPAYHSSAFRIAIQFHLQKL